MLGSKGQTGGLLKPDLEGKVCEDLTTELELQHAMMYIRYQQLWGS